jgi:microcystin-dependent protein
MSDPFLSEIRVFSFDFAPKGWAFCNGQLLPINQNQALFALIGTFYGGNGTTNFQLPNLQGRIALHQAGAFPLGQQGGEESHTLTAAEMPQHTHLVNAFANGSTGGTTIPGSTVELGNAYTSQTPAQFANLYSTTAPSVAMAAAAVGVTGGGQPHENRMPFLVLTYAIALQGIFPSRN